MRTFPLVLALLVTSSLLSFAEPGGALEALEKLPPKYRDGILKISADNGTPIPPSWSIVARNAYEGGSIYNIEMSQGAIIRERVSLDLRTALSDSPMNLSKITVGSDGAWKAGEKYSASKGKTLGSVSYALQQKGRDAAPIWSVWCYDQGGSYIGLVTILATNGAVVSSE